MKLSKKEKIAYACFVMKQAKISMTDIADLLSTETKISRYTVRRLAEKGAPLIDEFLDGGFSLRHEDIVYLEDLENNAHLCPLYSEN